MLYLTQYSYYASSTFHKFFLTQLRTPTKELAYFIGIQVACERAGPGQAPKNPGESQFYLD
jgi:hypothetical protein